MKNFWLDRLKLWKIHDGETHWYSASSEEDALKQHAELFDIEIDKEECEIIQVNDDFILPVREESGDYVLKTARKWCLAVGRGCVASTVY